jgi:hypothetical protein
MGRMEPMAAKGPEDSNSGRQSFGRSFRPDALKTHPPRLKKPGLSSHGPSGRHQSYCSVLSFSALPALPAFSALPASPTCQNATSACFVGDKPVDPLAAQRSEYGLSFVFATGKSDNRPFRGPW